MGGLVIPLFGEVITRDYSIDLAGLWRISRDNGGNRYLTNCTDKTAPAVSLLSDDSKTAEANYVCLGAELSHLDEQDIVSFSSDTRRVSVLWRNKSSSNTILLTERCDNYCIMCSQPPKDVDDSYLLQQANDLVSALKETKTKFPIIGITGGEPTLYGDGFVALIKRINSELPKFDTHVLSNGRKFSDQSFCESMKHSITDRLVIGIPIYGSIAEDHDEIVGADGAFYETVLGIHNLVEMGALVEVRVVLQQALAGRLVEIADFISRNLPGTIQVALMGLELMGFARSNFERVWIDPLDYMNDLATATRLLAANDCNPRIYNHQLCVLPPDIRHHAVSSISDWKREYDTICSTCAVQEKCGGFFASATRGISRGITPLSSMADTGKIPTSQSFKKRLTPLVTSHPNRRLVITPVPGSP